MNDYQLIVIGAGPGGYTAALRASQLGMKTAVAEARETGGTCLNRGCVPTKTLLHASEIYHSARSSEDMGIHAEGVRADMAEIFAYKRRISQTLSQGVEGLLKKAHVPLLRGKATITEPHTVSVTGEKGTAVYTADHILIATGSAPARPPIPGLDLPGVMTSDELLEGTDHLFRSIVIIGGGVIGVEFATFYADLCCEVTILEGLDRLLPAMDRELGQNLAMSMKKRGVTVCVGSTVQRIEKTSDGMLKVHYTAKDEPASVTGESVLCAIGRRPFTNGLFADGLAPETDGRSIHVNDRFETSIPGVYAVGDVSSRYQLAHVAAAQGTACVEMLYGMENRTDLELVPSCIYCRPEIASVGMTEAQAKADGIPVKVGKCVMGGNARTLLSEADRSFMKVVANAETGVLIGAHLMCLNSTDMISQLSGAIADHLTARQMLHAMRPHPTFEEALTDALLDLCAKLEK